MLRRLPVLLAVILLATACDAEVSQDPDPAPATAEVLAGLADLYAGSDPSPGELAESGCFAEALVGRLGVDGLREAGIVEDNGEVTAAAPMLDVDTAGAWVEAQGSCVDFVEVSARALSVQTKGRLDRAAYTACFGETITGDEVHAALVATLTGRFGSPEVAVLTDAQSACAEAALPVE